MNHLKLVVVGPKECGKSYICNFLSESIDQVTDGYHPTTGVRILEYEQKIKVKGKTSKIDVELWDTSGDNKFETCWPAIFRGSHGLAFVYNPDNSNHEEDLNKWYQAVPLYSDLNEQQMCVICHKKPNTSTLDVFSLPHDFKKIPHLSSNIPKDGEKFREQFGKFVSQLARGRLEANEQEELKIVNC
ncbi:Intraflagellar transport protein 22 [Schistosoma japonicum]|uniref:Intraflagellar transport protein 22 n=1 Tax=Schistosoma japonicum TaxID=6182 RepID=A0A4Z2DLZ9_SCHJA|nr:Intraflagellar transport protein 22 like [Schistosoma japonicum]TNN17442.1 Intraflagellar transport protein 22 [Schistosoma japonicum]